MKEEVIEEIIGILWVIASIVSFGFGYWPLGTVCAGMGLYILAMAFIINIREYHDFNDT